MDVKGARRVEIAGLNDKRQMTMVLAGTASMAYYLFQKAHIKKWL